MLLNQYVIHRVPSKRRSNGANAGVVVFERRSMVCFDRFAAIFGGVAFAPLLRRFDGTRCYLKYVNVI